jgi:hypothetical protein
MAINISYMRISLELRRRRRKKIKFIIIKGVIIGNQIKKNHHNYIYIYIFFFC